MIQTTSITQHTMLIDLTIRKWTASKHDKKVSQEVADSHNADVNMGNYNKKLLPKGALDKINSICSQARQCYYELTLPWSNDGARIISSSGYMTFKSKMSDFEYQLEIAVREFVSVYPSLIQDAEYRLNGLFDPRDYPPVHELKKKFAIGYIPLPVPTAQDFRVNLGDAEVEIIRQQIESQNQEKFEAAVKDVYRQLKEPVQHMKEKLSLYQPDAKNRMHDTMVTNIIDIVDRVSILNITKDPDLDRMAQKMREDLCQYPSDTLKISESCRERTLDAADKILEQLSDFI